MNLNAVNSDYFEIKRLEMVIDISFSLFSRLAIAR